ncbi:hypothetical protein FHW69_002003 [Luteibacter sp. Sphag1AF]|uniref:DUF3574 domain-containing protein n=1 Tax=Luteibacter sp. Sphag1AF TaxID=2587031 RepID=UPI00161070C6|nr:DUF3574 domain-containing protein [Luteibacter sp. Sphag1AF]MBB3227380.1 hypothetical protein [Luteibacter sp. Sphag1AF]
MKTWAGAILSLALLAGTGCATAQHETGAAATLKGDAAHPDQTKGWVSTSLYFGLGLADGDTGVTEAQWRNFLDREVSTRFPDGLSVRDVYGQWRGKGQDTPERLRSKELLLLYPDTPKARADVEAIRAAWKRQTGDQSVLRVTQPADVSF